MCAQCAHNVRIQMSAQCAHNVRKMAAQNGRTMCAQIALYKEG